MDRFKKILLFLSLCYTVIVFSQTKQELQRNKKEIENDIRYINKLILDTKKDKQLSMNDLLLLNTQIKQRENLISTITLEISQIDNYIYNNTLIINKLQNELDLLKRDYARLIYNSYKQKGDYNKLMFLFASKNFNQAYKRLKYLQQYSSYRKQQAATIINTQKELENKIIELKLKKREKKELLRQHEDEKIKLSNEKIQKNQIVKELQQKEKDLIKKLREKEKIAKSLQTAIEKIIAEEIRKAEEANRIVKASENISKSKKEVAVYKPTPEEEIISSNFESAKGRLLWPVEYGVITNSFGEHPHPVLKDVKTMNNGVDIATNAESYARAVFSGTVSGVVVIPGANNAVIIRHGNYLSVYSNLTEVYVNKGDKVKAKQKIGKVFNDVENSKTELHFEIWKNNQRLDPEGWLAK